MHNTAETENKTPVKQQKIRSPKANFWRNVLWYVLGSIAISLFIEQTLLFSLALILFISYRTVVKTGSWKGMFAPVIGSSLMQLLYFFSVRVEVADMGVFLVYQAVSLLGVAAVAGIGAGIGYLVVRNRRNKEEMEQKARQEKKQFQERVKKMTAVLILGAFMGMQVFAPVGVAAATVMSNGKTKQSIDEFIKTYDENADYQPHTEPIVEYVGGSGLARGGGAENGTHVNTNETLQLPHYPQPVQNKNIFVSAYNGISGWVGQLGKEVVKAAGNGIQYLEKNATNPGKMAQDISYIAANHDKWRLEGARDKVGGQLQGIWGVLSNPMQAIQHIAVPVAEVVKTYVLDSVVYAMEHPLQAVQAVISAPFVGATSFFANSVNNSVSKNYHGGWQGLNNDVATALENPETYWNVVQAPFTERTVELFEEGEYFQAMARAEGEMGVEVVELAVGEAAIARLPGAAGRVMAKVERVMGREQTVDEVMLSYTPLDQDFFRNSGLSPQDFHKVQILNKAFGLKADLSNWEEGAVQHMITGEVNKRGKVVGLHSVPEEASPARIIEGTKTVPDKNGVFQAQVELYGMPKSNNGGVTTLFPEHWSHERKIYEVNSAYMNKKYIPEDDIYEGISDSGVTIRMYINEESGKIKSPFPVYEP